MIKKFVSKFATDIFPYMVVFLASIYRPLDPDLGWHLRYGEYFFKNFQILKENIHSSEMQNFYWQNIAWGADLLYYIFYHLGGFLGLSLAAAAIITATFFFFSCAFHLDYWEKSIIFPLILFFEHPVNLNSFRGQLISILLLGILFFILTRFERRSGKSLYFIPILFFFWANLHGLFLLGLAIFMLWEGLFLSSLFIKERSFSSTKHFLKRFLPITLLSFVATLIHPFGIGIYVDALYHVNNPILKLVTEYGSIEELTVQWLNVIIVIILVGAGATAYVFKKQFLKKLPILGVFSVLYILSLWVRRYSWAMYYLVIPFVQPIARFLRPPSNKMVFRTSTGLFIFYLVVILSLKLPLSQYVTYTWDEYCQESVRCSSKAAEALRKYYKPGKTMTPYSWGGWMIWNYPDMKPSTDGRMHVWRSEKGYSGFEYDYKIAHRITDVDRSKYSVVFASKQKPIYKELRRYVTLKLWKNVYEDKYAAIFIRI